MSGKTTEIQIANIMNQKFITLMLLDFQRLEILIQKFFQNASFDTFASKIGPSLTKNAIFKVLLEIGCEREQSSPFRSPIGIRNKYWYTLWVFKRSV